MFLLKGTESQKYFDSCEMKGEKETTHRTWKEDPDLEENTIELYTAFPWRCPEASLYPSSEVETKAHQGQWKSPTSRPFRSEVVAEAMFAGFILFCFLFLLFLGGSLLKSLSMYMTSAMIAVPEEAGRRHQMP